MMRKWEYTAKALEHLGAPAEIIETAKAIDETLVKLRLKYNTPEWRAYCSDSSPVSETWTTLDSIIYNPSYCSACNTESGQNIECDDCALSKGGRSCTPGTVYGKDWFDIVGKFVRTEALKLGKRKR